MRRSEAARHPFAFEHADPEWVDRVARIAPTLRREGAEGERIGAIPAPTVAALEEIGVAGVAVPRELGGDEAGLATLLRVNEELARADAATGWCAMAATINVGWIAGVLPEAGLAAFFGGPVPRIAGMPQPRGVATAVAGGYEVEGSFQFASGSSMATHFVAGATVHAAGEPLLDANGDPEILAVLIPEAEVEKRGNWDVAGLAATASIDYTVAPRTIPAEQVVSLSAAEVLRGQPYFRYGLVGIGSLGHACVVTGIARRALEEIAVLAPKRRRPPDPALGEQQIFRAELARHDAALWSARALMYGAAEAIERASDGGAAPSAAWHTRLRQLNTYVHEVCIAAVDFAYAASGTTGLRLGSDIGRLFRDMHAASQHFIIDRNTLVDAAAEVSADLTRDREPADG